MEMTICGNSVLILLVLCDFFICVAVSYLFRFIGEGVAFDYNQVKGRENYSFSMSLEALDVELLEILSPVSSSTVLLFL